MYHARVASSRRSGGSDEHPRRAYAAAREREEHKAVIRWIVFDVGGIVVYEAGDVIDRHIARRLGISLSHFQRVTRPLFDRATSGEITLLDMYESVVREVGSAQDPGELLEKHLELYREHSTRRNDGVLELIADLRKRYHVACLTNTEPEIAEINKVGGLFDPFERAFLSTDMRLRKPQPEIFLAVLKELACPPGESLYIDDREVHVAGAQSVGMTARLFRDCAQIKSELAEILGTR